MPRRKIDIEEKIAKQETVIEGLKARLEKANAELDRLNEKKDAERKQDLIEAIENSGKSIDEVLEFLGR